MVDVTTIFLLAVAAGASFFAAWTIGAGSTGSTPFAPAVGANAITTLRATFIVGLLGLAGAVLQGGAITRTIGDELVTDVTLSPLAAAVALTIAAFYIAAGVFKGYPIATAFAITGSVVGVGIAMGGGPAWDRYFEIGLYWLLTPVFVAPASYVCTKLLRGEALAEKSVLAALAGVTGLTIVNMEFLLLGAAGEESSLAAVIGVLIPGPWWVGVALVSIGAAGVSAWVMWRAVVRDTVVAQRRFLLGLGGLVAFTAGGGKVGLAVGPLLPLVQGVWGDVPIGWILAFGGIGILLGSWMLAPRMIKALSQDYSELGPRRSIGVLIPSFVIAQIGIFFGIPMSFNEIFICAIIGTGYAVGSETVSREKLFYTVVAWVGSIVFSFFVGYGVYAGISMLTGTV